MFQFPSQTRSASKQIALAIIVGLCGGAAAVVTHRLISLFYDFSFKYLLPLISYEIYGLNVLILLLPLLGGLMVGPIIAKYAVETQGHGVPEVMEAVHLYGGKIRQRVAFVKVITSAITIGSGGSAGPEGPIAQIGSSLGSSIGQRLMLGERQIRLLVACGMASGIGATFNAPLGGAIFAMEILLTEFEAISATSVILASVVGTTFAVYMPIPGLESLALGTSPSFNAGGLMFNHPLELVFYLIMGLFFGVISILWVRTLYHTEDFFEKLKIKPQLKPAIGGFLTGIIGIFTLGYGIMGTGYEGVNLTLLGEIPIIVLILLGVGKILATSFTIGSGGSGGIFAPSLYIGCVFGGAFGIIFNLISPGIAQVPMTYALVGMGALFAGAANAPLTCIILIPEMANDWRLLPPIMIACVSSYLVYSLFTRDSIYTLKLIRKDVTIDVDHVLSEVRVKDIMTREIDSVSCDMKVSELILHMMRGGHMGYPVTRDGRLCGIITLDDLHGADLDATIGFVCTREIFTLNPMDSAQKAVRMLYDRDVGRLVVVDKEDPDKAIGIISRSDIIKAYQRILNIKRMW
jgi:CIC family chloride channel protein